ncbi:unnamed protein product [Leptosia nina]|uniref:Rrn7/TAF1B C-terminal cyclin domain-containing protein n=1 Tax=Leptosia nina TaxID=320188 RepID=A0AAV1IUW0_9NEOP
MSSNRCNVCGGPDMNLVDGFYYCVECGTQNENIQEHIVDNIVLGDGTMVKFKTKKIRKEKEDVEMSPEWYKWHAFNYIISGLTDELITAGAEPTVRSKILWIWIRYVKKFQVKSMGHISLFHADSDKENVESATHDTNKNTDESSRDRISFEEDEHKLHSDVRKSCKTMYANENCDDVSDSDEEIFGELNSDDDCSSDEECNTIVNKRKRRFEHFVSIDPITKGVIISILNAALNLDKSNIQLSHLSRLIKSGHINIDDCIKYIPEDLNKTKIPQFATFMRSLKKEYSSGRICYVTKNLFKTLDLGSPLTPNLGKMIDDYIKELCLPNEFQNLVESLMFQYPFFKNLGLDCTYDFEAICMSYIIVALKMCFGLDADYEIRLSEVVDNINQKNNYPKSYAFTERSENNRRLFSFKEWSEYLRARKMIVCKHNLFIANLYKSETTDDYIFLEHLPERSAVPPTLSQQVTMDILNKIPLLSPVSVIPKNEFDLIFTPLTTGTDVILEYIQDPELRLVLSEDFTQYSLDYAVKNLNLKENDDTKNIVKGISYANKIKNKKGHESAKAFHVFHERDSKTTDVYVSFWEKENFELTLEEQEEQTIENIKYEDSKSETVCNNDSDTDSSSILLSNERQITFVDFPNATIYDDDDKSEVKQVIEELSSVRGDSFIASPNTFDQNRPENTDGDPVLPTNFDRKAIVDDLLKIACKKYNLRLPKPRSERKPLPEGRGHNKRKEKIRNYNIMAKYYKLLENNLNNTNNSLSNFNNTTLNHHDDSMQRMDEDELNRTTQEPTDINNDLSKTEVVMNDTEVLGNSVISDEESLNSYEEHDTDEPEYTFPLPADSEIIENKDKMSELNKSINRILTKETTRLGEPPAKKLKESKIEKKIIEGERIYCGSKRNLKSINYWVVWFNNLPGIQSLHGAFNKELYEHFPHSFSYILHECGLLIDCCPSRLYRAMQVVEKLIASDLNYYTKRFHM